MFPFTTFLSCQTLLEQNKVNHAANLFLRWRPKSPYQTCRMLIHWFIFIFFAQSKENRSTSFEITGGADFALFGGSKVECLRKPRSGSRVTSDRAFSLSLSPAARGWLLLLWGTTGVGKEEASFDAGANAGAAGAGADEVNVEKKSSSKPFKKEDNETNQKREANSSKQRPKLTPDEATGWMAGVA